MPRNYFKLDLYFFEHPKVVDLSHSAALLFLASVAYSNRRETDGFIARQVVRKLIDLDPHDPEAPSHGELAKTLVAADLWEPVEGGWQIHDFFDHNDSSEERAAKREAERDGNRERQQRYRERKKADNSDPVSDNGVSRPLRNVSNAVSHPIEVEVTEKRREEKSNTIVEFGAQKRAPTRPATVNPDDVRQVFDTWRKASGKPRAKCDPKRTTRIAQALKTYPLEDVLDAVQGWRNSPHHCGANDRGTVYNELDLLLRDAAHIERFRDLARDGPNVPLGKRTRELVSHQQGMDAIGIAKGVSSNGHDLGAVGGNRQPNQRALARPAD